MQGHNERVALLILDGWGLGAEASADAIRQAHTPCMDRLLKTYEHSQLITHGLDVGLPPGQMGNSEVGHLNIGAGRVVYQQFARINRSIETGELATNEVLVQGVKAAVDRGASIHLIGLLSDGGVHSHIKHLQALVNIVEELGAKQNYIHAFLDGRDTDPEGGAGYLEDLLQHLTGRSTQVASLIGRYYAMDRDKRWERIKLAYDLLTTAKGALVQDLVEALRESYRAGVTDEFVQPMVASDGSGDPVATIQPGDLVICFNFRTDRPRQITTVLTQQDMPEHEMKTLPIEYISMTQYDEQYKNIGVIFDNQDLHDTLGEVLSRAGKSQVRIAETEKYPHVTFFFNGGREAPFEGEKRILIPSPKVATYDLQPAMSAVEITEAIIQEVTDHTPDFICLNYANTDMVGHTGVFEAGKAAAETVDRCVGQLEEVLTRHEYHILVIADHGNADCMVNADGTVNTAHTKNPVPCIYLPPHPSRLELSDGKLADIAPTILSLMQLPIPEAMDGEILLK